jgi:oxygen-independent coproporphyrinogen-3 oxidase
LPHDYVQNISGIKGWRDRIESGTLSTARGFVLTLEDNVRAAIIERLVCDLHADVRATLGHKAFRMNGSTANSRR